MSLVRPIRKSSRGFISNRAAVMCVAALSVILGRSAPPSLPHIYLDSTVTSHANHDHRLCFDHQDSQWETSPISTLLTRPPVVSPRLIPRAAVFDEVVTDGWHYNRAPPII